MDRLGLLALVFVVIPGYIADEAFRLCWGLEKCNEFERLLRCMVWSLFGLAVYALLVGHAPSYLPVAAAESSSVIFDRRTLGELAGHCGCTIVVALLVGLVTSLKVTHRLSVQILGRPVRAERPWDLLMRHYRKDRQIKVELTNGDVYFGNHVASSTGDDPSELALRDPSIRTSTGEWQVVAETRILYFKAEQIRAIHFSKTFEEVSSDQAA
jgi:hypothetical protein